MRVEVSKSIKGLLSYNDVKQFNQVSEGHPRLRVYLKDHKDQDAESGLTPTRPVIYAGDSCDNKVAIIVENALKKLIMAQKSCFLSLEENISRLQIKFNWKRGSKLVKADIKSLFPNIPQSMCLEYIFEFLDQN